MRDKPDAQLLRDYAEHNEETAFREIVSRYTDLVYSAARRQVESADTAADLAQSVFLDLARKSKPVGERLPAAASLAGWLHRSTRYAALNHLRDVRRRVAHEKQAMEQLLINSEPAADWQQIRPALDEALDSLADEDREALLLRYFKNQDFRAVGLALGLSDDAAQKRVSRAVEKLREFFSKRNVTISVSGLAVLISANAVQSAPMGLAATISAAVALTGAAVSTSTLITTTKVIAMTTLQKILAVAVSAAFVAAAGAGIFEKHQAAQWRAQNESLAQQIAQLQTDNESLSHHIADIGGARKLSDEQFNELLKLRGEVSVLRNQLGELGKLREENQRLRSMPPDPNVQRQAIVDAEKQQQETTMLKLNGAKQGVLAFIMFAGDNQNQFPTNFAQAAPYLGNSAELVETNFDIAYQGPISNVANPSAAIVLEEKQAWQALNGKWMKTYGFADGHAEVHTEPNGDFEDYEKAHRILSSTNGQ